MRPPGDRRAGAALLHPVALLAIVVLVLNDHVLKRHWPGVVSGKLSDFGGLAYFPLLLVSATELALERFGRYRGPSCTVLAVACVATGAFFAATKTTELGGDLYRWGFGLLLAPFRGEVRPVTLVADRTDLLALPAVIAAWAVGRARCADVARGFPVTPTSKRPRDS